MYSTKCWPVTSRRPTVSFIDSDDFMDLVAWKDNKGIENNQADNSLRFDGDYVSETGERPENFHENPKSC